MPHISIVSPVYKAEKIVDELIKRIVRSVSDITDDFEIILVDDCSPDNSWDKIVRNSELDPRVKGLKLSRNFGQHYAISAGLDFSKGDWIVVMDCDLQDQPEEIPRMYNAAISNKFDAVIAKRINRSDTFLKKFFSFLFYKLFSYLAGIQYDHTVANFGIYSRSMINAVKSMRENIRYFPTMVKWVGYNIGFIPVEHSERFEGQTSYNFRKLFQLALDIILAYSNKPLRMTVKLGLFISFFSFIFAIYNVYRAINGEIAVLGYSSLIVSIWMLGGIIILILGVIGLYLGKTFDGVKNRPIYIIKEKIGL